jgi:hypothetical protein
MKDVSVEKSIIVLLCGHEHPRNYSSVRPTNKPVFLVVNIEKAKFIT